MVAGERPLRIAMVLDSWDETNNGAVVSTRRFSALLRERGHTVTIFASGKHLVQFQILDRQPFDVEEYMESGELEFTGRPLPPDANEMGWKDTFRAPPGEVTRIITRFKDYSGLFVWHCHILEHEDHEMMRPFEVTTGPGFASDWQEELLEVVTPAAIELRPNFPNPFNTSTTIRFALPDARPVKLLFTDVTGRTVAALVNGWRDSGEHMVTFDAANLSSGIYFYRIKAGDFEDRGKMVLLQ